MTLTTYPSTTDTPDIAILNLSRLFTRLEHNLLSPTADLKPLRRSEYQRMRVGANVEYARSLLTQLDRSLPQIKPVDRRHELQTELTRKRQTLKLLKDVLDKINAEAEVRAGQKDLEEDADSDDEGDEVDELLELDGEERLIVTPAGESASDEGVRDILSGENEGAVEDEPEIISPGGGADYTAATAMPATTTTTTTIAGPTSTSTPSSTLRNRYQKPLPSPSAPITTGSSVHDQKIQSTEDTLSTHRLEQEDLTTSLLSLASQLKASSHAFQSSLEAEKSVLTRAVEGLDRTTSNMDAAEKRMGMLRRMTEGKGWWGRMMLYAWIFGLWIIAVLIVFLGPKLRF